MLDICILGPIMVSVDDRCQAIRSKKVRAALCILALNYRRTVSIDELIDELWGEEPPAKVKNALQANIVRLRRSLGTHADRTGTQVVRTMNNGYMLNVDHGQIDAVRFRRLAEQGRAELARRPEQAIDLLGSALSLWRGPALDDVSEGLRCYGAAVQLDEQRMAAKEDLVAARLTVGDARNVVAELRYLVAQYPDRERFSEQLMVALYRCGRQSEALDVFHRARSRLSSELGLEPGMHLRSVYQAILVQDPSLGVPASA